MDSAGIFSVFFQILASLTVIANFVSTENVCGEWSAWEANDAEKNNREGFQSMRKNALYDYDMDGNMIINAGYPRNQMITSSSATLIFWDNEDMILLSVQVCQQQHSRCPTIGGNVTLKLSIFGKSSTCNVEHAPNPEGFVCKTGSWQIPHKEKEELLIQFAGSPDAHKYCQLTVKVFAHGLAKCEFQWTKPKEFSHEIDLRSVNSRAQQDTKHTFYVNNVRENNKRDESEVTDENGKKVDKDKSSKHEADLSVKVGLSFGQGASGKVGGGYDNLKSWSKENTRRNSNMREKIKYFEETVTRTKTFTLYLATGLMYRTFQASINCGGTVFYLDDQIKITGHYSNGSDVSTVKDYPKADYSKDPEGMNYTEYCLKNNDMRGNPGCEADECGVASLLYHSWLMSFGICFSLSIGLALRSSAY